LNSNESLLENNLENTNYEEVYGVNSFRLIDQSSIQSIDDINESIKGFQLRDDLYENDFVEIVVINNETKIQFASSFLNPIVHCAVMISNDFYIEHTLSHKQIYKFMLVHLINTKDNKSMIKVHFAKSLEESNDVLKFLLTKEEDKIQKTEVNTSEWIEIFDFLKCFNILIHRSIGLKSNHIFGVEETNIDELRRKSLNFISDIKFIDKFAAIYGIKIPENYRSKLLHSYIQINPDLFQFSADEFFRAIVASPRRINSPVASVSSLNDIQFTQDLSNELNELSNSVDSNHEKTNQVKFNKNFFVPLDSIEEILPMKLSNEIFSGNIDENLTRWTGLVKNVSEFLDEFNSKFNENTNLDEIKTLVSTLSPQENISNNIASDRVNYDELNGEYVDETIFRLMELAIDLSALVEKKNDI